MSSLLTRLFATLTILAVLVLVGTVGYVYIEGQGLGDAFYMTVITVTAVGYEEVWPLSAEGRAFTMAVLLGGISWMGLWFATLTSLIVELDLKGVLERRRITQEIARMNDHVVVCGAGRTGRQVARELAGASQPYVIVEREDDRVEELREQLPEARVVHGDATHDSVLLEAGIQRSRGLIACLSADTDNLYLCLSARELAAGIVIVARAYEEESIEKLYRAGADHVVSPNASSAIRMASAVRGPETVSFADLASRASELALRMEQASVPDGSPAVGRTLAELQIPRETGLVLIAVGQRGERGVEFRFNPSGSTRIDAGDVVVVVGRAEQLEKLRGLLS